MQAHDPSLQPEAVEAFLVTVPPFDRLPGRELTALAAASRVAFYLAGEVIASSSAPITDVCCIQRGGVCLLQPGGTGEGDRLLDARGEGECFDVPGALVGRPDGCEVRASQDTFLVRLPQADFAALVRRQPHVAAYFGDVLSAACEPLPVPSGPEEGDRDGDYLFTRLAGEVASRNLVCVTRGEDMRRAARIMDEGQVGSVLVREASGAIIGIVTDRDLRRAVAQGLALSAPVETLMSVPVAGVAADVPCFEALASMTEAGIRHLLVYREGEASGMVTANDLLLAHGRSPMALLRALRRAGDVADLQALCARTVPLAAALAARGATAGTIGGMLTMVAERVLVRLLEFLGKRYGPPPAPCCWLALGPTGRREMLPGTGLSLAVVFDDAGDDIVAKAARTYLDAVAARLEEHLACCGLGAVAPGLGIGESRNRVDLERFVLFRETLAEANSPEYVDARPVAGDTGLVATVRERLGAARPAASVLAARLTTVLARPVPLGVYQGRLMERDGGFAPVLDVAERGSRPLVAMARLAALLFGGGEIGTAARLKRLGLEGHVPADVAGNAVDAFDFFERERLVARLETRGGAKEAPLRPSALSARRRQGFRAAFAAEEALRRVLSEATWPREAAS